jgi:hypothetical protein
LAAHGQERTCRVHFGVSLCVIAEGADIGFEAGKFGTGCINYSPNRLPQIHPSCERKPFEFRVDRTLEPFVRDGFVRTYAVDE